MPNQFAQIFPVTGDFVPTKASVHLSPSLSSPGTYFSIPSADNNPVIDATNFYSIVQSDHKWIYDNSTAGFTGPGYMEVKGEGFVSDLVYFPNDFFLDQYFMDIYFLGMGGTLGAFGRIRYPVQSSYSGTFNIWIRAYADGAFTGYLYLDGVKHQTLSFTGTGDWVWYQTSVALDTSLHIIGISFETDDTKIDKIIIGSTNSSTPTGTGPAYTDSPFLTTHARIWSLDGLGDPDSALYIYDYKTSVVDMIVPDWYNFNLSFLNSSEAIAYDDDNYGLVLSTSGINDDNKMTWDSTDYSTPLYTVYRDVTGSWSQSTARTYLFGIYSDRSDWVDVASGYMETEQGSSSQSILNTFEDDEATLLNVRIV